MNTKVLLEPGPLDYHFGVPFQDKLSFVLHSFGYLFHLKIYIFILNNDLF